MPGDVGHASLVTSAATATFATAPVGTGIAVQIGGLTVGGPAGGNYTVTQPTTTANITTKALTVSGITANKVYDGTTTATFAVPGSPLVGVAAGDTNVTLDSSGITGAFTSANAGSSSIAITGLVLAGSSATNYTLTQPTITATITPQPLTVTGITAANKVYDGTTTATVDASGAIFHPLRAATLSRSPPPASPVPSPPPTSAPV